MSLLKRPKNDEGPLATAEAGIEPFRREVTGAIERAWRAFEQDPWSALSGLSAAAPWPAIDVAETDASIDLRVDLPGLAAKDVNVEVSDGELTIRGSRREERTERNGGPYRHERYVGEFSRTIGLPSYADADRVEAKFDKGVLTVTVPKVPGRSPKRVPVKPG